MVMKKSDLKLEIKKYISEILSEDVNEAAIAYGKDSQSKNRAKQNLDKNKTFQQLNNPDKTELKKSIDQDSDGGILNLEEKNDNKTSIIKKLRGE
jgi:hypothetical protein